MKFSSCLFYKKMILTVICYSIWGISFAQGPFSYDTPLGKRIYSQNVTSKELTIDPIEFGSEMMGYDGLTIVTTVEMYLDRIQRLFAFTNSMQEKYLEIFYSEKTMTLRRYYSGTTDYYDYILYDQLFDEQPLRRFEIRLYCTGFFFWIQVAVDKGNYLSPVYFGLNTPNRPNMEELINANNKARIIIGDSTNPDAFFSMHGATAYAFHYNELRNDIYTRFSRGADAVGVALSPNEDEEYE